MTLQDAADELSDFLYANYNSLHTRTIDALRIAIDNLKMRHQQHTNKRTV